jgi:FMN phosphatase YigB (HAD superfamily)
MNSWAVHLDSAGIKLASFDVFDTLISRKCGAPETIFRIVGQKLRDRGLLASSPRLFEQMRVRAERRAWQHRAPEEVTLADIYAELNRFWLFPERTLREMMDCELEAERENLFAIPGAFALVELARRAGKRIAFVSDMYLPQEFLREMLIEFNLLRPGDQLYVSNHWAASKADGRLFPKVLQQEKLTGDEVLHLGDSFACDVRRAREQGIHACQLTHGALNRFEAVLARAEAEMCEEVLGLAGIARQARLQADVTGSHFVAARLGASLAGPIFSAYAEWLLRAALKRQLKRLYFLARDGEVLMRLCELLAPAVGAASIELRYLYGSREIWSPVALAPLDEAAANFFVSQIAWTTSAWEDCVEYLGFSVAEIQRTRFPGKWASASRNATWKKQILLDLAADADLGPALKRRLQSKADLAARYLSEQGLAETIAYGLVDCGWSGTWTDIIGGLATGQGGLEPLVFFLGRRRRSVPARCETLAWMFDHQAGCGLKNIADFFHIVVEFLLTTNHGRTVAFQESDGRLYPTLAPMDWQGFAPADWQVFRTALLGFVTAYAQQVQPDREMPDLRSAFNELVISFWEQPTLEEARFFAAHTIDRSRRNQKTLARPYRWSDAWRLAWRWTLPGHPPFWWHEGALALSSSMLHKGIGLMWEFRELMRILGKHGNPRRGWGDLARALSTSARRLKRGWITPREERLPLFQTQTNTTAASAENCDWSVIGDGTNETVS